MLPYDTAVRRLGLFAFFAAFCEALSFYAASLYAYALTGSVWVVSLLMTVIAVAEVVGALVGGTLADRLDRKRVALAGSFGAGLLLLALAVGGNLLVLVALMAAATIVSSPIRPVVGAALPNLLEEGNLRVANGYVQTLRNVALTLAPITAGLGVSVIGARGLFAAAATSLLIATIVLAFVRGEFHAAAGPRVIDYHGPFAAASLIKNDPVLLVVVAAGAVAWLVAACTSIADLPFALHDLAIGQTGYGVLVATWGVGSVLGAGVSSAVINRLAAARCFALATLAEGVILALVATAGSVGLVLAAFVTGGVFSGLVAAADQLLVQERVPDEIRGRVRATTDAIMTVAYAASLGVGGFVVAALGARGTYLVAGAGVAIAGIAATIALAPRGQALLTGG
jgi:MFS family permease